MSAPQRHAQLLVVGRTVFAERGLEGASVEEIAARAGVSKPIVYEHFGGKDGLYAEVVDSEIADLLLAGANTAAADRLEEYFDLAEQQLTSAYRSGQELITDPQG